VRQPLRATGPRQKREISARARDRAPRPVAAHRHSHTVGIVGLLPFGRIHPALRQPPKRNRTPITLNEPCDQARGTVRGSAPWIYAWDRRGIPARWRGFAGWFQFPSSGSSRRQEAAARWRPRGARRTGRRAQVGRRCCRRHYNAEALTRRNTLTSRCEPRYMSRFRAARIGAESACQRP
jgi:hypothetical protein